MAARHRKTTPQTAQDQPGRIKGLFNWLVEAGRDVYAAVSHKEAMPSNRRLIEEGKVTLGAAGMAVGAAELNVLAVAAGAASFEEGLDHLRESGHDYRAKRPEKKTPSRAHNKMSVLDYAVVIPGF